MKGIKRIFILEKKYRVRDGVVGKSIIHNFEKKIKKIEEIYTEDNLLFDLTGNYPEIISNGKKIIFDNKIDFVFDRYSGYNFYMTSLLSFFLKKKNIKHSFGYMGGVIDRGIKHYQYLDLKFRNIPIPKTFIGSKKSIIYNYNFIKENIGKEFVVKATGSQGKFVFLIKNKKTLKDVLSGLGEKKNLIAVQEKINSDYDTRIIFVKNKILSAMKRTSPGFLNNYSQGGFVEGYLPSKKDINISIKAIKNFGLDYVGIDLMYDNLGNPVVIEIQPLPQSNGMRKANPDINFGEEFVKKFLGE
ncbi:MAG TPA: hypothetical protein EYG89_05050 [Bacteroidia bacterium]|nr:hypothetical protein [Bacteroidia bacterium]